MTPESSPDVASGRAEETARTEAASQLMLAFADRTGLTSRAPPRRYLWTDAFAVCSFLGLAQRTGEARYVDLALRLVEAVHTVLGRHRADGPRSGWLSGLSEPEGALHPTAGGLRIGKNLPERAADEPFDEALEWERDGQYFHYLTQWMHALDQVARHTGQARFNVWARELAKAAHAGFVRETPSGLRMVWKMSVDLSRPLVPSMGQHDPLDGLVSTLQLQATAAEFPGAPSEPSLVRETAHFAALTDLRRLSTLDPLGLGALLMDASRVAQLGARIARDYPELLGALLTSAAHSLRHFPAAAELRAPAESRLAFRELGLSIGLKGATLIAQGLRDTGSEAELGSALQALWRARPLADAIDAFWLDPEHRHSRSGTAHRNIDEVMLATSLVPEGYLRLSTPAPR